ncbi:MAG: 50S ribosomal protein L24 [Thermoguttaceae bacterium]|nr:50S ribosomal protein L24 [Thermoguttaceae bacterium]
MRIKVNDTVEVITGKAKGKRGKVMSIDRKSGRAIVAGLNQVSKHVKPNQRNPRGGILKIEQPIQLSNLMFVCPICGKATRLGARFNDEGIKELFCKKCKATVQAVKGEKAKAGK